MSLYRIRVAFLHLLEKRLRYFHLDAVDLFVLGGTFRGEPHGSRYVTRLQVAKERFHALIVVRFP